MNLFRSILITFLLLVIGCSAPNVDKEVSAELSIQVNNHIELGQLLVDYKNISSNKFAGRKTGTKGNHLAQKYIISALKAENILPLFNSYRQNFSHQLSFSKILGNNIIGFIPGKKCHEKYVVLTAHFDHLGKKGASLYLGADDNASGVAALLAISRLIKQKPLNCNTIILFTDAEEKGLLGAKAFAREFPQYFKNTVLNINLDMLAGDKHTKRLHFVHRGLDTVLSDKSLTTFSYIYHQMQPEITIKKGFRQRTNEMNKRVNWLKASDHGVFYQANVPFIYYGVGTHKNYHTAKDKYENSNTQFLGYATNAIYQHLRFIDENAIY